MANKAKVEKQEFSSQSEKADIKTEHEQTQAAQTPGDTTGHETDNNQLEDLRKELQQKEEMLLRLAAEYDNFKKRTEREREALTEYIKAQTLKPLLPALDNTERALAADPSKPDYAKGVELIVKQLKETLIGLGLVEIAAEGEQFNPELHEAVMHIEDESVGENIVVKVLQKGYKLGDTVIRPAMVQVAN